MTLTSLAANGWVGIAVVLIVLLKQQIRMLGMWLVFGFFRTSQADQNEWLLEEARRNDKVTLVRDFLNRRSQQPPKTDGQLSGLPSPRLGEAAPAAELSGDAREPRSPPA